MRRSFYLETFLLSLAVILLEVSYTRVFSYKLVYYFTYLIIGISLLGLGSGGVFFALFERLLPGATGGAWGVRRPLAGELRAAATVDGTTLSIVVTARGRPTRNELVATGTAGTAHVDLFHGYATFEGGGHSRVRKVGRPFARGAGTLALAGENLVRRAARGETAYPGLRELIRATYASIADGTPPPITPAETRAVAAARDAILASPRG